MKKAITFSIGLLVGISIGCCWNFYKYQPIKVQEKNEELRLDLHLLNKAYVRDISKKSHFIDDSFKINLK